MNPNDRNDGPEEEPHLRRYREDTTSPLERFDDKGWQQRRLEELKEVIKGPSTLRDRYRAEEEYHELQRGCSYGDEIDFGR